MASTLIERAQSAKAAALSILDAADAEGRNLTDDEQARVDEFTAEAVKAKADHDRGARVRGSLEAMAKSAAGDAADDEAPVHPFVKAVVDSIKQRGERMHFPDAQNPVVKAFHGEPSASTKALAVSGSISLPVSLLTETMPMVRQPVTLLSLITGPIEMKTGSEFSYLRQTTRTNNAAPVAIGALKPTSSFGLERVEGPITTIAHLSDPIPRQYLEDMPSLQQFISMELFAGLVTAIEGQVLNGDGTLPNLRGIDATSGLGVQPFATDALTTIANALSKVEVAGYNIEHDGIAIVMNPADWLPISLLKASDGAYLVGGPGAAVERRLWGVPVVLSSRVDAGYAFVGNFSVVHVVTRNGIRVDWTENVSDDFMHNHIRFRCEGRFGLGVLEPGAIVKAKLTAP